MLIVFIASMKFPTPAIEKEDLDGLIEQLAELRDGLVEIEGRIKEQPAR
jgi:hypothetical protein